MRKLQKRIAGNNKILLHWMQESRYDVFDIIAISNIPHSFVKRKMRMAIHATKIVYENLKKILHFQ